MSKKKVRPPRTTPAPYVSVKYDGIGMHARFLRNGNRVVLCKLNISGRNDDWDFDNYKEGKALCHPGDVEKEIPPDVFDEKVGIELSFTRAIRGVNRKAEQIRWYIDYHKREAEKAEQVAMALESARDVFAAEFVRLKDNDLITCEQIV